MHKKSSRDVEFAVRLAIEALRRELDGRDMQMSPDVALLPPGCARLPAHKRRRDLERAISILKAIKLDVEVDGSGY